MNYYGYLLPIYFLSEVIEFEIDRQILQINKFVLIIQNKLNVNS